MESDSRMKRSNVLNDFFPEYIRYLASKEYATKLALSDLDYYRNEFLCDLSNSRESFSFHKFALPIKGVYVSFYTNK